ncbi:MAG: 50S ribosomal protein L22 [Bacteroidota bacterium]
MGAKSRNRAEQRKEEKKTLYFAKLNNCPTSPRKMRLIADLIRGKKVEYALQMLKTSPQQSSERLRKLLLSAIANWQAKNEGLRLEESNLYVKEIHVDSGRMLKRLLTAPQGRAHRVRKRSNHVTIYVDSMSAVVVDETAVSTETKE